MGCGLCEGVLGPEKVKVHPTDDGDERPQVLSPLSDADLSTFRSICPGLTEIGDSLQEPGPSPSPVWGPIRDIRLGYAGDEEIRFRGASGGALSALSIHLIESGEVDFVAHVRMNPDEPLRSEPWVSRSRADVIEASGSRYAPTAPLRHFSSLLDLGERFAFVGKPCDVGAIRNLARLDPRVDEQVVALLTFACTGMSRMPLYREFLGDNRIAEEDLELFRFRGEGCPGPMRALTRDGREASTTYNEFWEGVADWRLQLRCKLCPDAVGYQADIMVCDTWPGGAPDSETEGFNAVVARSKAGERVLRSSIEAGSLVDAGPLSVSDLDRFQPQHVARRRAALPRAAGLAARNRVIPRFRKISLLAAAREAPLGDWLSGFRGSWERAATAREEAPGSPL